MVRVDRRGRSESLIDTRRAFFDARPSPDGRLLALEIGGANRGLWVYDIARTTLTRLALGFDNASPVWTPDGKRVTFASSRFGQKNLFWQLADGSEPAKRLTTSEYSQQPGSWSPDGTTLVFEENRPETGWDLVILSAEDDGAPRPFLQTPSTERQPAFSADGRFVAYESDESGQIEVYVRSFPDSDMKWKVSTEGGRFPVWSADGHELFYRSGDQVLVVDVATAGTLTLGNPKVLYEKHSVAGELNVMPDGQSFVMIDDSATERGPTQLNLVLNWSYELERLTTPCSTTKLERRAHHFWKRIRDWRTGEKP